MGLFHHHGSIGANLRGGGILRIPRSSHELTGQLSDTHTPLGAMVAASGVGAIPQAEWRRGHNAGLTDTQQLEAISTGGATFNSDFKSARAKQAQRENEQAAAQQQKSIDASIAQLRAAYGIADPNSPLAGLAGQNAGALQDDYSNYARDFIGANTHAATQGFDANERAARFAAASTGQTGGSVDALHHQGDLSGLLGAETGIAGQAQSNVDSLRSQDQASRLGLEGEIVGGTASNESISNGLRAHSQFLGAARSQIPVDALGQLASYGGTMASTYGGDYGRALGGMSYPGYGGYPSALGASMSPYGQSSGYIRSGGSASRDSSGTISN